MKNNPNLKCLITSDLASKLKADDKNDSKIAEDINNLSGSLSEASLDQSALFNESGMNDELEENPPKKHRKDNRS